MVRLNDIENAIRQLPPDDLTAFREWFAKFDAEQWDRQIEADSKNGKLKQHIDEALRDFRDGRCNDL